MMPAGTRDVNKPDNMATARKTRSGSSKSPTDSGKDKDDVFKTPWEDESWTCKMCSNSFQDKDDKVIECDWCRKHFCTRCLDKGDNEYSILANSDCLWFCVPCLVIVQENLKTDYKIEQQCAKAMKKHEDRLKLIEDKLASKCEEKQVRDIRISEETRTVTGIIAAKRTKRYGHSRCPNWIGG